MNHLCLDIWLSVTKHETISRLLACGSRQPEYDLRRKFQVRKKYVFVMGKPDGRSRQ